MKSIIFVMHHIFWIYCLLILIHIPDLHIQAIRLTTSMKRKNNQEDSSRKNKDDQSKKSTIRNENYERAKEILMDHELLKNYAPKIIPPNGNPISVDEAEEENDDEDIQLKTGRRRAIRDEKEDEKEDEKKEQGEGQEVEEQQLYGLEYEEDEDEDHEIPLFIIAGTQKSGSTVLAGYLAHHPNIAFAKKKELHFFDKITNYEKGIAHYLDSFPPPNQSTLIFGEATPYYLASKTSCERIAEYFPSVKMIIILREPIARAYSEYQMKVRRILDQDEFYELIREHIKEMVDCMRIHKNNYKSLENCFPEEISKHGRYSKFPKALRKATEHLKDWNKIVNLCFPFQYPKGNLMDNFCLLSSPYGVDIDISSCPLIIENASRKKPRMQRIFDPDSCWKYYPEGNEFVKSIEEAFVTEVEEFQNCSQPLIDFSPTNTFKSYLSQLDQAVKKCLTIQGGITRGYFYRSLYLAQFYNCFKSIPREQFLVIGNRELKEKPHETMKRVCQFLEIPYDPIKELVEKQSIESLILSKFPSFERTTSWKIKSEYEPIPEEIREYLEQFFKPYNELLFHYLKKNFAQLW